MSETASWIHRDEGGQFIKRILDAAPPARKSYILELRSELRSFVSSRPLHRPSRCGLMHLIWQHEKTRCRWLWLYSLGDVKANLICFV